MSSSDLSLFSGFTENDIPGDYDDNNKGVLYNISETSLGEDITITFLNKAAYQTVLKRLENIYNFKTNQPNTGKITHTMIGSERVVITAYNTHKLVIQGKESPLWKNTVFRSVTETLSNECMSREIETNSPENLIPIVPREMTKSRSTGFLGLFGPSLNKGMIKLGHELKKAKKMEKKGKIKVNFEEFDRQIQVIQETGKKPKEKLHRMGKVNDSAPRSSPVNFQFKTKNKIIHETVPKTLFESTDSDIIHNPNVIQNGPTHTNCTEKSASICVDTESSNENTEECEECSTVPLEADECDTPLTGGMQASVSSHSINSDTIRKEMEFLRQENLRLIEENNTLLRKNDTQYRIIKSLEKKPTCDKQTSTVGTGLQTSKQQMSSQTNTTRPTDAKLAGVNAQLLIKEEENFKLKDTVKTLKTENRALRDKLSEKSRQAEDAEELSSRLTSLQDDISAVKMVVTQTQQMLDTVPKSVDITLLQQEVRCQNRGITSLQDEIKKNTSLHKDKLGTETNTLHTPDFSTNTAESGVTANRNSASKEHPTNQPNNQSNAKETETAHYNKTKVCILGDSVTRGLDIGRFSGESLDVKIKSHPGADVKDISFNIPAIKEKINLSQSDMIIIHAGINNVSNADDSQKILQEFRELIAEIKKTNQDAKISVSSLLPKKHDKLSFKIIDETNSLLKQLCQENGYVFIDHTTHFTNNGTVNKALFRDETHLTHRGTSVLAKSLKSAVFKSLDFPLITGQSTRNFRSASLPKHVVHRQYPHQGPHKHHRHPYQGPHHHRRQYLQQGPQHRHSQMQIRRAMPPWARFPPSWIPQPYY